MLSSLSISGYANEVGESFRALVHVNVVRFSYVVACAYVAADARHKGGQAAKVRYLPPVQLNLSVEISLRNMKVLHIGQ